MHKFKFLFIIIIFFFMGYHLFCEKNQAPQINKDKITLKLVTNRTDLVDNTLKDMADKYMEENPDINLIIEGIKQPNELLKIKASAGEGADITIVPTDVNSEALTTFYEPLDDLGFNYKNLKGYSAGIGNDNRLHAVNSSVGYAGIVYNKNSFNKAGISKIPQTLSEFYDVCEKLKNVGIIPFAINVNDEWPLNLYSCDYILPIENTGDKDYREKLLQRDLFSNDGGLYYSLKFLETMKNKGYIEPNFRETRWSTFKRQHARGDIAMTFLGSWYPNQLIELGASKDDIGMFPFPDTKVILQTNDWMFAISKNSSNVEEAKKLFKWLFFDGNYAKACNIVCPVNDNASTSWFLKELFSYNKGILVIKSYKNDKVDKTFKNFGYSLPSIFKEYLTSDNPEKVIKEYNDLWNESKIKTENESNNMDN